MSSGVFVFLCNPPAPLYLCSSYRYPPHLCSVIEGTRDKACSVNIVEQTLSFSRCHNYVTNQKNSNRSKRCSIILKGLLLIGSGRRRKFSTRSDVSPVGTVRYSSVPETPRPSHVVKYLIIVLAILLVAADDQRRRQRTVVFFQQQLVVLDVHARHERVISQRQLNTRNYSQIVYGLVSQPVVFHGKTEWFFSGKTEWFSISM